MKTGQTNPFLGFTKKSNLPRVVWAEESKNGLSFEIRPSYNNVPTASQFVTDGQSICSKNQIPLVSQFQCAIVCHQRTKIGGAREN